MIGILIAILVAALVYWLCLAARPPAIVGIVAAILVLLGGVGAGGGFGAFGGRIASDTAGGVAAPPRSPSFAGVAKRAFFSSAATR